MLLRMTGGRRTLSAVAVLLLAHPALAQRAVFVVRHAEKQSESNEPGVPMAVVLKRLKYGQPIYRPDSEHFHHRMARIGFSSRRTIAYLYAWTLLLAGLALALRFIPYSDHKGHYSSGWTLVVVGLGLFVAAASVYLVYVLEILKFRRVAAMRMRRLRPDASAEEIDSRVARDLETGEFQIVAGSDGDRIALDDTRSRAEQGVGQRQVDQDGVGAEQQRGGAQAPVAADRR